MPDRFIRSENSPKKSLINPYLYKIFINNLKINCIIGILPHERLNKQTLMDLDMEKAIIQVSTPVELYKKLKLFKDNPDLIQSYQLENNNAINKNTWHDRAKMMQIKFKEICN